MQDIEKIKAELLKLQNIEKANAEIKALHKLIAKAERLFLQFPEDDAIPLMISQYRHRIREFEKMLLPSSRIGIKSCSINCDQGDFCEGGKCDINGCYKAKAGADSPTAHVGSPK